MKRIKRNWPTIGALLVMLTVAWLVQGCATTPQTDTPTFTEVQYKAIAASQELYNLSWGAFVQLYRTKAINKAGKLIVDQDKYTAGLKVATTYYEAWMTWIDAVMAYEANKGVDGKVPVEKAMDICQKAAIKLLAMIQPYLTEGK